MHISLRRHGNPTNITHIFLWEFKKKKKMKHLFGRNGKEVMVIFSTKNANPQFFLLFFDIKIFGIPKFVQFLEFPFLKVKI